MLEAPCRLPCTLLSTDLRADGVRPAGKLSKAKQAERQARILGAEQAVLNYIHTTPREDIVPATYLALMMAEWETRHENDEKKDDDDDDDDDDEDIVIADLAGGPRDPPAPPPPPPPPPAAFLTAA